MKKNSLLMIAVALILSSCGIASQYASSSGEARFQDGIYNSSPSFRSKAEKSESRSQTDALIEETKASRIYLFGEKKDTVMIPQNMSASIRYDKSIASTVVTVGENPYSWQYNVDPWYYYTPYSIGSSWYWSRHYDPWYWNRWSYSPWSYYGGWYDPYYYGGWYDPWYYGYAGWYGYMHPHYCGWYGGWDPYWDYHHHHHFHGAPVHHKDVWHGSRYQTRSDKVFTSRVSTRGGTSSSRVSRAETGTSTTSRVASSSNASSSRSTATRVTATPVRTSAVRQEGASKRTVSDYRRPGTTTSGTTSVERSNTTRTYRASSSSSSSSSYRSSGSSSYRSSGSPSYRSSGSSSYRSSGSSSSSRSSSFSGGGSSRSGGSHGRR